MSDRVSDRLSRTDAAPMTVRNALKSRCSGVREGGPRLESRAVSATFKESGSDAPHKVRTLVHALCYDDLLAGGGGAFVLDDSPLPFRIGRAAEGEATRLVDRERLSVADRWASTSHCHLRRVGISDIVQDDGSRNGTWVNGERVDRFRALVDGDVVEVGHTLLSYRLVDEHAAAALAGEAVAAGPTTTRNAEMASVIRDLRRIARAREPGLLTGGPGVGKETAALAVHDWSGRRGPLHVVDCGALADAATGAALDGGTVLLDAVERLGDAAQTALLRVVEEGRLGPAGPALDVRWIATTTANLHEAPGGLRADLLRSLAGYIADLPPLRRRREDLGTLGAWLLSSGGFERAAITPAAGRALFLSAFPGNIRQLRTVLRAAATLAGDGPVGVRHLPPLDAPPPVHGARPAATRDAGAPTPQQVVDALQATGGNVVRAAECLGAHPRQVYRWIERHDIDLDRFRH